MHLIRIVGVLIIVALAALSFWQPRLASWTFLAVFVLCLEGYVIVLLVMYRKHKIPAQESPYFFTDDEAELVTKFALHFSYPGTTIEISSVLAANAGAAIVFVPILAYNAMYVEATLIGLNWCLALPLSHMLSPLNGLKAGYAKGDKLSVRRLAVWESAWEKTISAKRALPKNN